MIRVTEIGSRSEDGHIPDNDSKKMSGAQTLMTYQLTNILLAPLPNSNYIVSRFFQIISFGE